MGSKIRSPVLSPKAEKARSSGTPLPEDPYTLNWYGEQEKEVFSAVGGHVAYAELSVFGMASLADRRLRVDRTIRRISRSVCLQPEWRGASAHRDGSGERVSMPSANTGRPRSGRALRIASELADIRKRYISGQPAE
jgi:hypothetical protein